MMQWALSFPTILLLLFQMHNSLFWWVSHQVILPTSWLKTCGLPTSHRLMLRLENAVFPCFRLAALHFLPSPFDLDFTLKFCCTILHPCHYCAWCWAPHDNSINFQYLKTAFHCIQQTPCRYTCNGRRLYNWGSSDWGSSSWTAEGQEGGGATWVIYQLEHIVRLVDNMGRSVCQINNALQSKVEWPLAMMVHYTYLQYRTLSNPKC